MQFQPGHSMPGPGRPKGAVSGRSRALQTLDAILADEQNIEVLRAALQAHFRQNPVRFFRQIIMPLMPKDVSVKMGVEGAVQWTSLLTAFPDDATSPHEAPQDAAD